MNSPDYKTVRQVVTDGKYPFSIGQMRHFLIHRHRNGLEEAVRKIGRRLYLRMDHFDQWIETQATRRGQR